MELSEVVGCFALQCLVRPEVVVIKEILEEFVAEMVDGCEASTERPFTKLMIPSLVALTVESS